MVSLEVVKIDHKSLGSPELGTELVTMYLTELSIKKLLDTQTTAVLIVHTT